jgi:nitrogen fixation/metabolism regulation signal transduction histidine kinase
MAIVAGFFIDTPQSYISLLLLFFMVLITINLVHYINRINRKVSFFFDAALNEDFSLRNMARTGDSVEDSLNERLSNLNDWLHRLKEESLRQEQYLEALLNQIGTGVISVNDEGFVIHANNAARTMLEMEQITHLRQLKKKHPELYRRLESASSPFDDVVKVEQQGSGKSYLLKATQLKDSKSPLTLFTMQDISPQLSDQELESWVKLIRVLTHEIMNALAPLTSLSETLTEKLTQGEENKMVSDLTQQELDITVKGLSIIQSQGEGLMSFVKSYRKFTGITKPVKKAFELIPFLQNTIMLFGEKGIPITANFPDENIEITADEGLLSQVMINIITNALDAVKGIENPEITINVTKRAHQTEILVRDNGCGMSPEVRDQVFIPFFTTKEDGNGIGLSLSRQIVHRHGGSISVESVEGEGTTVLVVL